MRVLVPFGRGNRNIVGYCIGIRDHSDYPVEKIKEILGIYKDENTLEDKAIALATWIRRQYGSTMSQALNLVLPAKHAVKPVQKRILHRRLGTQEAIAYMGEALCKQHHAKARLLKHLLETADIPYEWVTSKLHISPQTIQSLVKVGVVEVLTYEAYRNPVKIQEQGNFTPLVLSEGQQAVVDQVVREYEAGSPGVHLLHGITGSGKTQVYISVAKAFIEAGKQVIILIPEIALTYQTLRRFYQQFGDRVSVLNSSMSQGERYDQCRRARNGEIDIIIGPRSALFTPFPNIGIIIIDEEQESSYKSETTPKYHAREVARKLAELHGASLLLGSATPSLEAYYQAKQGRATLHTLRERLTGGTLPHTTIVDLRQELKEGNRSIFSKTLQDLLADRLDRGEQSMIFLNRRGLNGFISCRACGFVAKCSHCDLSLSEHADGLLHCHLCGYTIPKYTVCPKCGSPYISGFRAGTQQIEEKLHLLFPRARILRMDADTTRKKDAYEAILGAFAGGEADILIGTQMIIKGHDFPNVTLMGILAADMSLHSADYHAAERTFQMITQAAGRAGRGERPGEVVIQTYQPDHYALMHAANQDYEAFYEEEIAFRKLLSYPPVAHILAVQLFGKDEAATADLAQCLAKRVRHLDDVDADQNGQRRILESASGASIGQNFPRRILGPAPATIAKVSDVYRYTFYVKCAIYDKLVEVKDFIEETLGQNTPKDVMIQYDFNPMNIL
jgi:primosomal protein N' (replication factor Y)